MIIASGPSACGANVDLARGRTKAIAINSSWQLAPWADMLFASDVEWWRAHRAVPEFSGLKATRAGQTGIPAGIRELTVRQKPHAGDDEIILEPGIVAGGGSSGFQALNLAVQLGCVDIALVGYDASLAHGRHWHGDHGDGLKNPVEFTTQIWRQAMDRAKPLLDRIAIRVVNCSAISTITAFPKTSLEDWLECSP